MKNQDTLYKIKKILGVQGDKEIIETIKNEHKIVDLLIMRQGLTALQLIAKIKSGSVPAIRLYYKLIGEIK